MFCTSGKVLTNYVGTSTDSTSFKYMTAYNNSYTTVTVYDGQYMRVGF